MLLFNWLTSFVCCILLVHANTETHVLRVPNYFDVRSDSYNEASPLSQYGSSSVLYDYPIMNRYPDNNAKIGSIVMEDPLKDGDSQFLLVRLNNYNDTTLEPNNLLFIKLCWPATIPVDFELSHKFLYGNEDGMKRNKVEVDSPSHALYLVIKCTAKFKTYSEKYSTIDSVKFKLVIQKLPNPWVPIPLEVYDIIMYLVDVGILLWCLIPKLPGF
ncbi:hypothetical protein PSN45_003425 [Yamadazyma tenuis]|uniref:Uncharacterized protein n=1 Tax=Candida tenuis (strain ATCC 10573 / BCRC 21748 / CBS 615 / JCM 9827 / NBRC 10315 / NRRL Y-1498 / VKM Y-70) TaxID=590646 RepID=G3AY71_CANTC|nr:uncharacterized protein CANTEDRAFT_133198 [Yamadazyma tenuis ATCC 10573]EGV65781.1 hypothetical protein CANTEDRAFT_133198 [Yamadazyma tenuis ATCC 10573]WEJ95894.1 hypothetical protein PSN45_003425 [Yamadazyma tenuis]